MVVMEKNALINLLVQSVLENYALQENYAETGDFNFNISLKSIRKGQKKE